MLHGQLPNYNVYACADGKYVALGALEPQFFQAFCTAVEKPEWMQYAVPTKENNAFLTQELTNLFLSRSRIEWVVMAEEKDMCLTPVLAPEEVKDDAHFQQRNPFLTLSHPVYGDYTALRFPFSFLETDISAPWADGNHCGRHLGPSCSGAALRHTGPCRRLFAVRSGV